MPCHRCKHFGHCLLSNFMILGKQDAQNPALVSDSRRTTFIYFLMNGITPTEAPEFLADEYMKLETANDNERQGARMIDRSGNPVLLDTSAFDPSDEVIDTGAGKHWLDAQRNFFKRNFFTWLPYNVVPHVHPRNYDLYLLTINVVGARLPQISRFWRRGGGDNDNFLPLPIPANDN